MNASGIVLVEDVATAMSGAFNAGYFARYWLRGSERGAKRTGAAALVLIGVATASEAVFSQVALRAHDQLVALGGLSDGVWALARLPLLLATAREGAMRPARRRAKSGTDSDERDGL